MSKKHKSVLFAEELKQQIDQGIYPFGSPIPSERNLSDKYHLSRVTVRESINQLINENYLLKSPSRGTFVNKNPHKELKIHFKGMTELLRNSGFHPYSHIIASEVCEAGYKLSNIFNVTEKTQLFRIMRLRGGNNQPISIEDTYIPLSLIPHIEQVDLQLFSLYDIFAANNVQIDYINHIISSAKIRNNEARMLNLNDGDTVISIKLTSYTQNKIAIEHTKVLAVSEFSGFYTDCYIKEGDVKVYAQSD